VTPLTVYNEVQFQHFVITPFRKYLLYQTMAGVELKLQNDSKTITTSNGQQFQTLNTHCIQHLVISYSNAQTADTASETQLYEVLRNFCPVGAELLHAD
jgi:hypothetical protein